MSPLGYTCPVCDQKFAPAETEKKMARRIASHERTMTHLVARMRLEKGAGPFNKGPRDK